VAVGVTIERLAKFWTQPVWLGIQEFIDKLPILRLAEIDLNEAKLALELADDRLQGMSVSVPAKSHVGRAVDADNKNRTALEPPAQME
jgi:hypothetical protein